MKASKLITLLRKAMAECGDSEAEVLVYCPHTGQWKHPQISVSLWNEYSAVVGPDELPAGVEGEPEIFVELS